MASSIALGTDEKQLKWTLRNAFARAWKICRNHHVAEDATQQAFLEHFLANSKGGGGHNADQGYLPSRAADRAKDAIRKSHREAGYIRRIEQSPLLRNITDPARLANAAELMFRVHRLLDDLDPPARRLILRLIIQENLSNSEVCESLGMPSGTMRSHLCRGIQQLHERMKAEGILDQLWEELQ